MELRTFLFEGSGVFIIIMTLVQISPIEINPWNWIARKIGGEINKDVIERVDNLSKDISDLRKEFDEGEATLCRTRILRFNDELIYEKKHTKEHFDQVLTDITRYEAYCESHPKYKNNIATLSIEKIKKTYKNCMDKNSFLKII